MGADRVQAQKTGRLTPTQREQFARDGFTYARGLFAPDEVALLPEAMERDPAMRSNILDRRDAEGRSTRIALWNRAGDSVYGLAASSRRMVDVATELLGGPVYHYQSKLTAKEPDVGGAWEWHQEYGSWNCDGCLHSVRWTWSTATRCGGRARGSRGRAGGALHEPGRTCRTCGW